MDGHDIEDITNNIDAHPARPRVEGTLFDDVTRMVQVIFGVSIHGSVAIKSFANLNIPSQTLIQSSQ